MTPEPRPLGAWRLLPLVLLAAVALVATASPAAAHGGAGTGASDHVQRLDGFDPGAEGVHLSIDPTTQELRLTNTGSVEVVVLGYSGEPYLRVLPDEVWVNTRSPATYLNDTVDGSAAVPDSADTEAEPEWQLLGPGPTARWHDHRSHWMGETPEMALLQPDRAHELATWTVPFEVDGRRVVATGTTIWEPGPDPAPWVAAAVVLALVVPAAALLPRWRIPLGTAAALLVVAGATSLAGDWWGSPDPWTAKLTALGPPTTALAFVAAGIVCLRRLPRDGLVLVGLGALALSVLFGFARWDHLGAAHVPTGLDHPVASATVAAAVGLGVGLTAAAAVRWRSAQARGRATPRGPGGGARWSRCTPRRAGT